jgi:hypothetical protein
MRIAQMSKKDITAFHAKAYAKASKKRKGELLDELSLSLCWSRDNTRRQLKKALRKPKTKTQKKKRTKPPKYSALARTVLANVWVLSGQACGQYLVVQIQEGLIERLLLHQELRVGRRNKGPLLDAENPVIEELKAMSSATIDRYLRTLKKEMYPKAKGATKPTSYALRNEIPFGKSYTAHKEPGYLSIDTVAHCGSSLKGDHIWTVNSTDTVSGWTETQSIPNKSGHLVKEAHEDIIPRFPFPIHAANYDGGSEFINREMIDYAKMQNYNMTRSRPYHANDNAHIEQKNGDIVRRYAFRYRYYGDEALDVLNALWYYVNLRKNFLMPTKKCIGHTKTKSGRTRGLYDKPQTPAKRLLSYDCVDEEEKAYLRETLASLNDAEITREILKLQDKLISFALDQDLIEYIKDEVQQVISA